MATEARIAITSAADIVTARQEGRLLASQLGFSGSDLTVIATAISEIARNILEYAKRGEVVLSLVQKGSLLGLSVVATDSGPGIRDIARAMQDGYTTARGLGIGLPGARRLMDEFEITSQVGRGTTIVMRKYVH